MIPLLINQSNIFRDFSLRISKRLAGVWSSCYWTDWNRANTDNIRIGLVFAVLDQWTFLYCIDKFDHIKANKLKLINNVFYGVLCIVRAYTATASFRRSTWIRYH
jgi:hypothetical protein